MVAGGRWRQRVHPRPAAVALRQQLQPAPLLAARQRHANRPLPRHPPLRPRRRGPSPCPGPSGPPKKKTPDPERSISATPRLAVKTSTTPPPTRERRTPPRTTRVPTSGTATSSTHSTRAAAGGRLSSNPLPPLVQPSARPSGQPGTTRPTASAGEQSSLSPPRLKSLAAQLPPSAPPPHSATAAAASVGLPTPAAARSA